MEMSHEQMQRGDASGPVQTGLSPGHQYATTSLHGHSIAHFGDVCQQYYSDPPARGK